LSFKRSEQSRLDTWMMDNPERERERERERTVAMSVIHPFQTPS